MSYKDSVSKTLIALVIFVVAFAWFNSNRADAARDLDVECIGAYELYHDSNERMVELVTTIPDDHCTGYLFVSSRPLYVDGQPVSAVVSGELLPDGMMLIRSHLTRNVNDDVTVTVNFVIDERGTLPPVRTTRLNSG